MFYSTFAENLQFAVLFSKMIGFAFFHTKKNSEQ